MAIASDLSLPAPKGSPTVSSEVDLRIMPGVVDTGHVRFAPLDGVEDLRAVGMRQAWAHQRVVLSFPGVLAELPLVGSTILIDADRDDPDYVAHVVLDHVVPRWLALRGDLVLHAGAVVSPAGRCVAFMGRTGQGKSSMVTALSQAGWLLLSDDACRMVLRDHAWHVTPSYVGVRLTGASREALVPHLASAPMAQGSDKHRVVSIAPPETGVFRVGLLVALGDELATASTRRLTLSEATASLTRHSFHLAPTAQLVAPRAFELASALAAAVPCVQLDYRRSWDVYPELIELVTATEASLR